MTRPKLKSGIVKRAQTDLRIDQELTDIVEFLITHGYIPGEQAIKTPALKTQCPAASYNRIERLHDPIGMVQKYNKGPDTYLIHTRKDEIVNGQGVSAMVNEELSRIAKHVQQNPALRPVVADARNMGPGQVLQGLTNGGFAQRRDRLERIVDSIKGSNVSQGPYGKIIFRTPANHYRASPLAVQLYQ